MHAIRDGLGIEHFETRARLHVPFLEEILEAHGMKGAERRDQFIDGFRILGQLAGPGVYPPGSDLAKPIPRGELFQ